MDSRAHLYNRSCESRAHAGGLSTRVTRAYVYAYMCVYSYLSAYINGSRVYIQTTPRERVIHIFTRCASVHTYISYACAVCENLRANRRKPAVSLCGCVCVCTYVCVYRASLRRVRCGQAFMRRSRCSRDFWARKVYPPRVEFISRRPQRSLSIRAGRTSPSRRRPRTFETLRC